MTKSFKTLTIFMLTFLSIVSNGQIIIKMQKKNGTYRVPCKVNGRHLNFVFDTGASDVSLSLEEAVKMINLGLIDSSDFLGTQYYRDASGNISEGIKVNIKLLEIDKIILKNVEALIVKTRNAPLLLGQTALSKLGKIEFDPQNETFTILNKTLINNSYTYDLFRSIIFNEKGLIDNFCGFKLLQYEDCIFSQFGKPTFEKNLEEDEKYVVYKKQDENLIFRLAKLPESAGSKQIVSIQISGKFSLHSVRGIKLGSSQSHIFEIFGTPSKISNIKNDYGNAKFIQYDNYNISFELNNERVTSISVFYGNISKETTVENEQLANFKLFKNALTTFTQKELLNLFHPEFEISCYGKYLLNFKKGFQEDYLTNTDVINFIKDSEKGLKSLLSSKITTENIIRLQPVSNDKIVLLSVLKIKNSKYIHEIVLKQHFGRLLIWEIN